MKSGDQTDPYQSALDRLRRLIAEAHANKILDAEAAALATADTSACPSVRMITILAVETEGLLFFASIKSGKGHQLLDNPKVSLCFYWPLLREQVIIEGSAKKQTEATSDQYWHRRLRESQLAAWASSQSEPVTDKGAIREQIKAYKSKFDFDPVSRHPDWHAFRIVPERIEFWPTGWERLRERVKYLCDAEGHWHQEMLSP
ncbi:MAG: pyridoxal 5'-phosphate synthase [Pseudomonadales bacterium]|nr:pyridoxal 5'-phosphate synthase [Pseudomonadales bacterium]